MPKLKTWNPSRWQNVILPTKFHVILKATFQIINFYFFVIHILCDYDVVIKVQLVLDPVHDC